MKVVPITEMKDTAAFSRMIEAEDGPVIVTKNGRESMVVLTPAAFEALRLESARTVLYERIDRAEQDFAAGRVVDGFEAMGRIREKYGL